MSIQAKWGDFQWGLSQVPNALSTISWDRRLLVHQQDDISGSRSGTVRGMEPVSVSLDWTVALAAGTSIESDLDRWNEAIGQSEYLVIGERQYADVPLRLVAFTASNVRLDSNGVCRSAEFHASFQEVRDEAGKKRSEKTRRTALRKAPPAVRQDLGVVSGADVGPSETEIRRQKGGGR